MDERGVLLRSERRGTENGRVYLLFITADDGRGGVATAACGVGVPHDQSDESIADVIAQTAAAVAHAQAFIDADLEPEAPTGYTQHGLSEELGPKQ